MLMHILNNNHCKQNIYIAQVKDSTAGSHMQDYLPALANGLDEQEREGHSSKKQHR